MLEDSQGHKFLKLESDEAQAEAYGAKKWTNASISFLGGQFYSLFQRFFS